MKNRILKTPSFVIAALLSGCFGNLLMDYSAYPESPIADESFKVDLSKGDNPAKVYFESWKDGSKRKMLLLTEIDNIALTNKDDTGSSWKLRPLGYQVLVIDPGTYSLGMCYIEKNAVGGANNCRLGISEAELEAGQKYMVRFSREGSQVSVFIKKLSDK